MFIFLLSLVFLFFISIFLLLYFKFLYIKRVVNFLFPFLFIYFVFARYRTGFYPLPQYLRAYYNLVFYENDVLIKESIDLSKKNKYFLPTPKRIGVYVVSIELRKNDSISKVKYDLWNNFTFIFKQNGIICKKITKNLRKRSIYFEDGYPLAFCRFEYPLNGKYYENLELEILPLNNLDFLQGYDTELVVDYPYPK